MKLVIPLQSAQTRSVRGSPQRLVNMHTVSLNTDSTNVNQVLYPTPGMDLWLDLLGSVVRGTIEFHGTVFVVYDNQFAAIHYIDGVKTVESIGVLQTYTGSVSIAATFDQLLIVDGIQGYLYTKSTAVYTQVTDSNFPVNCTFVAAQDTYFMALVPDTDTFFMSNGSDGSTWPALRFASTNAKYDNLVAMLPMFGEFWMFCTKSTEVWFDAGDPQFPYTPEGGAFLNYGCSAPETVLRTNTGAFWLGTGGNSGSGLVLFGVNSTSINVISTQAMHDQFKNYSNINDAFSFSYQFEGLEFIVLTFRTDCHSWQYCVETQMWNELTSVNTDVTSPQGEPAFTRWRPSCYTYFPINNGIHLVGDSVSGKIFQLSADTFVEDTTSVIQRIITTPNLEIGSQYVTANYVELLMEPGQARDSGQGFQAQVALEISRDGGFTWGN